jgi:hypothetical protein
MSNQYFSMVQECADSYEFQDADQGNPTHINIVVPRDSLNLWLDKLFGLKAKESEIKYYMTDDNKYLDEGDTEEVNLMKNLCETFAYHRECPETVVIKITPLHKFRYVWLCMLSDLKATKSEFDHAVLHYTNVTKVLSQVSSELSG